MPDVAVYLESLVSIILGAIRIMGCLALVSFCVCATGMVFRTGATKKDTASRNRKRHPPIRVGQSYALFDVAFRDCDGHTTYVSSRMYLN